MDAIQGVLTDLRRRLAELYGPRLDRLFLFGSRARGDAEEGGARRMTPDQEQQIMRAEELIRVIEERVGPAQVPES